MILRMSEWFLENKLIKDYIYKTINISCFYIWVIKKVEIIKYANSRRKRSWNSWNPRIEISLNFWRTQLESWSP